MPSSLAASSNPLAARPALARLLVCCVVTAIVLFSRNSAASAPLCDAALSQTIAAPLPIIPRHQPEAAPLDRCEGSERGEAVDEAPPEKPRHDATSSRELDKGYPLPLVGPPCPMRSAPARWMPEDGLPAGVTSSVYRPPRGLSSRSANF